ncbi:MAG: OmpA family protein [bacterium]|nr:OmpA family protein [bacterium]
MTRTENDTTPAERRLHLRGWTVALAAIAAWVFLVTNSAEAQQIRVPEIVLAQVLGPAAEGEPAPEAAPADPSVALVAMELRQRFQDQLVAGVARPSVELEVHFDFDSDALHEAATPDIEAAASVLVDHFPNTRFRVAGYTDAAGSAEYNMDLSQRRAAAVYRELVEIHGVPAGRLESKGFGEDATADATAAQRRRVELQILRDGGERL